jgi:hypothetical protein
MSVDNICLLIKLDKNLKIERGMYHETPFN